VRYPDLADPAILFELLQGGQVRSPIDQIVDLK
jgi:hypothetical protein